MILVSLLLGRRSAARLLAFAGALALAGTFYLPASSSAVAWPKGIPTGYLTFDVSYEFADRSGWNYDVQEECSRDTGNGRHTITADVGGYDIVVPVRTSGGKTRVVAWYAPRTWDPSGNPMDSQKGRAKYFLESTTNSEATSNTGSCAPIGSGDPSDSLPPSQSCGTRNGTLELSVFSTMASAATTRLNFVDEWSPAGPFSPEDGSTFCEDRSVWQWSSGFPAIDNPEKDADVFIDNSKLLGYFTKLKSAQRSKCKKPKASYCRNANYVRSTKTIELRDEPAPKLFKLNQTSVLTITFKFTGFQKKYLRGDV